MAIYLVQHGLCLPKEVDPDRPLSAEGLKEVQRIAEHIRKMRIEVGKVCHSGKTRAMQTAQIFADHIGNGSVCEVAGMAPNDSAADFAAAINEDDAMYVGHLPHMGKLASYLITGEEDAGVVQFANGAVVCVEKDSSGFHMEWFLKPSMCC